MTMRFSQSRLIDQRKFGYRTRFLGKTAFRAYYDLTEYYWEFGRLFSEDSDLADVCGLHVQSFRRIKDQLSRLFDIDDTGLWRDPELEEERARAMQRSATNRANGRKGGQAKWGTDDPDGMGWASDGAADVSSDMANGMANAMGFATETEAENGQFGMATAIATAMPPAVSLGSIDRSSVEDSEMIDRSNPREGAGEAMANGMANASPVAMPVETSTPAAAGAAPIVADSPSDADLHARVLAACGGNITDELRQSRDVEPIRALMRDGFDLEREILPLLRDRVKAFATPVRSLRGKWIRQELDKARAAGVALRPPTSAAPATAFVAADTAEWAACQAREVEAGHKPKKPIPNGKTGQNGNWFAVPLPLPPAARPSIAAE